MKKNYRTKKENEKIVILYQWGYTGIIIKLKIEKSKKTKKLKKS